MLLDYKVVTILGLVMYWFELLQNYAENENFLPDDEVVTIVGLVVVPALPPTARVVALAHSTRV